MIWIVLFTIYIIVVAFLLMLRLDDPTGAFGWPVLTAAWLIRMAFLLAVAIIASFLHGVLELVERTIAIFAKGPQ